MSTGNWKHRFYTHKKYLSRIIELGVTCIRVAATTPHVYEISPVSVHWVGSEDILGWNLWDFSVQGMIKDEEPMKKGERTTAQVLIHLFLYSNFNLLVPLFFNPKLSTLGTIFKVRGREQACNTWNSEESILHTPFCPIHSGKKHINFAKSYVI